MRNDREARFYIELSREKNCTIAYLLGLVPKETPPSSNEIEWLNAYHSIVPMSNARFNIFEARLLGMHCGKSPMAVIFDPWSPLNNPDWLDQQKRELEELQAEYENNKKLAENVEDS